MGRCIYCRKFAGIFRNEHPRCVALRKQGWEEMVRLAKCGAAGVEDLDTLEARLIGTAERSFLDRSAVRLAMALGWEQAAHQFLADEKLEPEEEIALETFRRRFGLSQEELSRHGTFWRVVKVGTLRDLVEGKVPRRFQVEGPLPFVFDPDESLIFLFSNTQYLEQRSTSFQLKGDRIVWTQERTPVDTGILAVATKHVYFTGSKKGFRIALAKIAALRSVDSGVETLQSPASAKTRVFLTDDGEFTYRLLRHLAPPTART